MRIDTRGPAKTIPPTEGPLPGNDDSEHATRPPEGVRRRRVFYLHGFDPRGPSHYHGLYREQAARQAALSGAAMEVHPRKNRGKRFAEWRIEADYDGDRVETTYEFLRWDDLARAHWSKDELVLLRDIWRSLYAAQVSDALGRMRRGALPSFAAVIFPATVSTLFLVTYLGAVGALSATGFQFAAHFGLSGWIGVLPPLLLLLLMPAVWRRLDVGLNVNWLNRSITYMVDCAAGRAATDDRWDDFARRIAEAGADPDLDEVLVVGHSQGAPHAARLAAAALRLDPELGRRRARFGLLTLGQAIAFYTALPDDRTFRNDLAELAVSDRLIWVDYTAPSDPASAGGVDPLTGIDVPPGAPWPIRRSPRFHKLMSAKGFRAIRGNALKFHFQYLMAGERLGEYDYFRLTAGPDVLGTPSPNRAE